MEDPKLNDYIDHMYYRIPCWTFDQFYRVATWQAAANFSCLELWRRLKRRHLREWSGKIIEVPGMGPVRPWLCNHACQNVFSDPYPNANEIRHGLVTLEKFLREDRPIDRRFERALRGEPE
jgi:hypothetical protein